MTLCRSVTLVGFDLPPKYLEFLQFTNKQLLEERVKGLNRYLHLLVSDPRLMALDCVRSFFQSDYVNLTNLFPVCLLLRFSHVLGPLGELPDE